MADMKAESKAPRGFVPRPKPRTDVAPPDVENSMAAPPDGGAARSSAAATRSCAATNGTWADAASRPR